VLFDHFSDYSKEGKGRREDRPLVLNGHEFKSALDMLAPTWPPPEAPPQPLKKLTKDTIDLGDGKPLNLQAFQEFFEEVKGFSDTKEMVEDFEKSDPAKNKTNGIVAIVMVGVTIVAILFGVVLNHILFFYLAVASASVAVYLILYIHECTAIDFPFMPKPGAGLVIAGGALTYFDVGIPAIVPIAFIVMGVGLLVAAAANYNARQELKKSNKRMKQAAAEYAEARAHAVKELDKKAMLEEIERKKRNSKYAPDGELEIQEDRRKSNAHMPPSAEEKAVDRAAALERPAVRPGMSAEELAELGLPGQVASKPDWVKRNSKKLEADGGKRASVSRPSNGGYDAGRQTLGPGPRGPGRSKSKDLSLGGSSPARSKDLSRGTKEVRTTF
jgi:hypothetical protein